MQGKIWGTTTEILNLGHTSMHLLKIKKGGFCSEHQHAHKENAFFVISGRLKIYQWRGTSEGEKPDITVLEVNEPTSIPAGMWHKFEALEETVCLETYYVRLTEDITRRKQGGLNR